MVEWFIAVFFINYFSFHKIYFMKRKDGKAIKKIYLKCDKCNDIIINFAYNRHYRTCKGINKNLINKKSILTDNIEIEKINNDLYICKKCNKEFCKTGIGSHYWRNHTENGRNFNSKKNYIKGSKIAWNKGFTLKDQLFANRITEEEYNRLILASKKGGFARSLKSLTKEEELIRRKKISEKAKINNGGYRQGSGRGKKGWYKGFFCDSSYELAYVIYNLDHNIKIERNTEIRTYEWEGKIRNYIPDFICNSQLVEIKGFKTKQWLAKLAYNTDISVLYKEDLKHIFDYIIDKYGKNFISLYEKK
jgi:hypothetical protein